jgi:hypothetical protein
MHGVCHLLREHASRFPGGFIPKEAASLAISVGGLRESATSIIEGVFVCVNSLLVVASYGPFPECIRLIPDVPEPEAEPTT